ncbi:MAG: hypothetical protein KF774_04390 [Planctomyces sp.]|nr:hypothetical protein [Planctomyces sp.]
MNTQSLLIIATVAPSPETVARCAAAARPVQFLDLSDEGLEFEAPGEWTILPRAEFFDADAFRTDFLTFLEEWPRKPIWKGKSFDELFRLRGGYSLWWTGPAAARTPMRGIVPALRAAWLLDRVLREVRPTAIVLNCPDASRGAVLRSRCESEGLSCEWFDEPKSAITENPGAWFRASSLKCLARGIRLTLGAWRRPSPATLPGADRPSVAFASRGSRYFDVDQAGAAPVIWKSLSDGLRRYLPNLRQIAIIRDDKAVRRDAMPEGLRLPVVSPKTQRGVGAYLRSLPSQLAGLWRLRRLESTSAWRSSFRFANSDVERLFQPALRRSVEGIADWTQRVADCRTALQQAGRVAAVLVGEEFYSPAMPELAAAKELGLLTIGVQHGTIMPTHYIYTVPRGHIAGAPVPDRFAAYGPYSVGIVSGLGAYPRDRVWNSGASRLDRLVSQPLCGAEARKSLGLPADRPIVLITMQTYPWFPRAVATVLEALAGRPECVVCVKTHPKAACISVAELQRIAGEASCGIQCFDDRFDELLAACDVLVSASSTTMLEAILAGKRTVCLNFSTEPDWYPYAEEGPSLAARSREEIGMALDEALRQADDRGRDRREAFLLNHVGPTLNGRGTRTFIEQLAEACGFALPAVEIPTAAASAQKGTPVRARKGSIVGSRLFEKPANSDSVAASEAHG